MVKRYADMSLAYAVIAMISGIFYREFTKFSHFSGKTSLSLLHTHYFLLGMVFFLLLMLAEKSLSFSGQNTGKVLIAYQAGLHITAAGFLMRGLVQIQGITPAKALDASISGIAGTGHILTGVCMILLLLKIRRRAG